MKSVHEYPTPETDVYRLKAESGYPAHCINFAGSLERRLAACRETLRNIETLVEGESADPDLDITRMIDMAHDALKLTSAL